MTGILRSDSSNDRGANSVAELRAELALESARADFLQREVNRAENATVDAELELRRAQDRVTALEDTIASREHDVREMQQRLSSAEERLQAVTREASTATNNNTEISTLAAQLVEAKDAIIGLPKSLAEMLARFDGIEALIKARKQSREPSRLALRLPEWASWRPAGFKQGAATKAMVPSLHQQRLAIEASKMFDPQWYLERYPDVATAGGDPIAHYVSHGWREGRDPAPGFSTDFYLDANPDVRASGANPLYHYVIIGRYQGRVPSQDAKVVEGLDQAGIVAAEFDEEFYRRKTGLRGPGSEALAHFMRKGWREGRDPHPQFSTRFYLKQNADVWRAGINPYVHYLIAGRREGRLPRQFPGLTEDLVTQWQLIAREFDVGFYRSNYADVVAARFEPVLHYLLEGWKQEKDPHPQFSTTHYLDNNPDVREAGINPYYHYLAEGRREGRTPRRAGTWAPRKEVHKVVADHFDTDFYLARNPDVAEAAVDPIEHFLDFGWKEGRDPNADFSIRFYLETNEDVAAAGVNPLYHYLVAGRTEGRLPMHPGGWRALTLQRLRPFSEYIERASAVPAELGGLLNCSEIVTEVRHRIGRAVDRVFVTISHDDYTTSVGGVQLCLTLESQEARSRGIVHVNLHPKVSFGALSRDKLGERGPIVVTCNGSAIGTAIVEEVSEALRTLRQEAHRADLSVHSLLAHSTEAVVQIHEALRPDRSFIWLHDFFSICASYTLLRNGIEFCHAPSQDSAACTLCVFGEERRSHEARIRELFDRVPFEIIAPSPFAAEFWRSKSKLPARKLHVCAHCKLTPTTAAVMPRSSDVIRVAFLGHPSPHKGWEAFLRVLRHLHGDSRYEFHHFGAGSRIDSRTIFTKASVLEGGPSAMIDALVEKRIDVAFLWSIWPETFSFVAHEAICAGVTILTNENSGNIARVVKDRDCGVVLADEQALVEAFESGAIHDTAIRARGNAERFTPRYSKMTLSLLGED